MSEREKGTPGIKERYKFKKYDRKANWKRQRIKLVWKAKRKKIWKKKEQRKETHKIIKKK